MKRRLTGLALAALTAAIIAVTAAPAAAVAPFPEGDTFYAVPCHDELTLKLVDPSDGSWVDVGSQTAIGTVECGYQPAFNPVTKESYFVGGNTDNGEWPLVKIDVVTGVYTVVHEIWDGTSNLDFTPFTTNFPGNMFITNAGIAYFIGGEKLYPLDLQTGIVGPQIGADLVVSGDIYATACSMVEATCYILTENGELYEIDPSTGTVGASLGLLPVGGNYSLQVASDGTLWSSSANGHVASFSAADPAGSYEQGGETVPYSGAYLITNGLPVAVAAPVAADALAASGTDSAAAAVAAGLVLALGGILLAARRRAALR